MSDIKTFIIYYHKSPENKYYVGITSKKSAVQRWHLDGSGYKTQKKFWDAIQFFGWNNFEHVIIGTGLTRTEAVDAEQFFIKVYDSKNNGYNADDGGLGSFGHTVSLEARHKMSLLKLGKYTEAQKIGAISAAKKHTKNIYTYNLSGELLNTFFGYDKAATYYNIPASTIRNFCNSRSVYKKSLIFLTDKNKATLPLIIESFYLAEQEKTKPTIGQYDLTGAYINSYLTYKEAADITGIPLGSISKVCSGFDLKYRNYIFIRLSEETIGDRLKKIILQKKRDYSNPSYLIQQFDADNNLIATYDSYDIAARSTGISKKLIISNCTGKCNSCKHYIFKKLLK